MKTTESEGAASSVGDLMPQDPKPFDEMTPREKKEARLRQEVCDAPAPELAMPLTGSAIGEWV